MRSSESRKNGKPAKGKTVFPVWRYLFALLFAVAVFLYVRQHHFIWQLGYEVAGLEETRDRLIVENKRLSVKLKRLESLLRIEKIAGEKLGMRYPDDKQFMLVDRAE